MSGRGGYEPLGGGNSHLKGMHAGAMVAFDFEQSSGDIHETAKDLSEQDVGQTLVPLVEGSQTSRRRIARMVGHEGGKGSFGSFLLAGRGERIVVVDVKSKGSGATMVDHGVFGNGGGSGAILG